MTTEDRKTRDFFFRWMIIIGVVNLIILAVMAVGLVANFGNTTDEIKSVQARQAHLSSLLRTSNILSCERGATHAAYEIVEAGLSEKNPVAAQKRARSLFRIRNCQRSEDKGRQVYLSPDQADDFISGVAARMGVLNWDRTKEK